MEMFRQGDVLIVAEVDLAPGLRKLDRDRGRIVLAEGEVTGHAHAIADRDVELWESELAEGRIAPDRWLVVGAGGATLTHEEHGAIAIPPGTYRVVRQREYAPDAVRNVAD